MYSTKSKKAKRKKGAAEKTKNKLLMKAKKNRQVGADPKKKTHQEKKYIVDRRGSFGARVCRFYCITGECAPEFRLDRTSSIISTGLPTARSTGLRRRRRPAALRSFADRADDACEFSLLIYRPY